MSWTLFKYIFKDLVRIFMMASGALAGIMSFGGLLRPLTQNGLDGSQVALLLANFMPAMSTYSLPVAALFATTMVYGRMSADNEITACRASGISFFALTWPAFALGLLVAGASAYLLCFTVPRATLQIERVIESNLAKLIAHEITQTHQMKFNDTTTVFARDAYLPPPAATTTTTTTSPSTAGSAGVPHEQAVVLRAPLIVNYATPPGKPRWYQQAKSFMSSSEAVARVVEDPDDGSATLTVSLTGGVVFPRSVAGVSQATQGGATVGSFGPILIPSRVGEKTKFLTIEKLKQLQDDPSRGQQVQQVLGQFIRSDQAAIVLGRMVADLQNPPYRCVLPTANEGTMVLSLPAGGSVTPVPKEDGVVVLAGPTSGPTAGRPVQYRTESGGQVRLTAEGPACRVKVTVPANQQPPVAEVAVHMQQAVVDAADEAPTPTTVTDDADIADPGPAPPPATAPFDRPVVTPLPPDVVALADRTAEQYLRTAVPATDDRAVRAQRRLRFAWFDLTNHIASELHARGAFIVSCVLLVLVGSSLGMMFRSGNFLTAFAVSVVPALLSTVLIVTGQHTAESTPLAVTPANNPLHLGMAIIWSGNVAIGVAAVVLLVRLQRR